MDNKPVVSKDLCDGQASLRSLCHGACDEIHAKPTRGPQCAHREVRLVSTVVVQLHMGAERRKSSTHAKGNGAERPHIHGRCVVGRAVELRRHVAWGADAVCSSSGAVGLFSDAEVCNLDEPLWTRLGDEDVL